MENSGAIFSEWLERYRAADDLFASAYESVGAKKRSLIKTGIALARFYFGAPDSLRRDLRENEDMGFWAESVFKPVDWACLVFGGKEMGAARICATAIAPALAGVKNIIALALGGAPVELLVTLELCGVEDLFILDSAACARFLNELRQNNGAVGRICCLDCGDSPSRANGCCAIQTRELARGGSLLLANPADFNEEDLYFCQGMPPALDPLASPRWACVYGSGYPEAECGLRLGPGCEGFWVFPGYGPGFFRSLSFSAGMAPGKGF